MAKENCTKSDLIVQVKSRRKLRFKAGSDLTAKVNAIAVDFNEELTEDAELLEIKISLTSEACSPDVCMN